MIYYSIIEEGLKSYEANGKDSIKASFEFLPESKIFKGHFPGNPVLSGIAQLEILKYLLLITLKKYLCLSNVKSVKFYQPVLPNQKFTFVINYSKDDEGRVDVKCKGFSDKDIKIMEITARYVCYAKKEK